MYSNIFQIVFFLVNYRTKAISMETLTHKKAGGLLQWCIEPNDWHVPMQLEFWIFKLGQVFKARLMKIDFTLLCL